MHGIEFTPEHPVDRFTEFGTRAEAAGFDTAFISAHYFNRDPFVVADRVASATDELQVGPGVVNPYEYHPVTLASRVASLDEASGGRAVFGIGPGDPSALESLDLDAERGLRSVLEAFKIAQRLWRGESVDHDGIFEITDAELRFDPPAGDAIPVYVGGEGPHMCRMAAKHADGLLYNGSHPADLAWARERVSEGLEERPAERGAFDLVAYASVSIAEDADAAREAARPPVAFIAGGAPPPVLERHGIARERATAVGEALSDGEFSEAYGLVTRAMLDAFCVWGTPDDVEEQFAALLDHADSVVVGAPLGPTPAAAIESAGTALRSAATR